jgi:chromosome segregation ATPase
MSDATRNLTLERIHRLTTAVADLMESHASQGRMLFQALERIDARFDQMNARLDQMEARLNQMDGRLGCIETAVKELASEQVLLGNRVENAFSRALRAHIRMDELEGAQERGF